MASSYKRGTQIALHFAFDGGIGENETEMPIKAIYESIGEAAKFSTHYVCTDDVSWYSVVIYGPFFSEAYLLESLEKFIFIMKQDNDERFRFLIKSGVTGIPKEIYAVICKNFFYISACIIIQPGRKNIIINRRNSLYEQNLIYISELAACDKRDTATALLCIALLISSLFSGSGLNRKYLLAQAGIRSRTTLSAKLSILRECSPVKDQKDGNVIYYQPDYGNLNKALQNKSKNI